MPILIEGISVVILRWAIDRHYSGRWKAFVAECPNDSLVFDGHLAGVTFMAPADAAAFVARLANKGLSPEQDGEARHVVLVDQNDGPLQPCPWIEVMRAVNRRDERIVCARLKGAPGLRIAFPKRWKHATSLTRNAIPLRPSEVDDRARFLGRVGNLDIYEDLRRGGLAGAARVTVTGGGEKSLELELRDIGFAANRFGRTLHESRDDAEREAAFAKFAYELIPRVSEIIMGEGRRIPLAYHTLGILLRVCDWPEKALDAFKAANQLEAGNIETVIGIVVCHLEIGSYSNALDSAREATALAPLRAEAWELRTIAADASGHLDEARAAIKEALLLEPHNEDYLEMLSQLQKETATGD